MEVWAACIKTYKYHPPFLKTEKKFLTNHQLATTQFAPSIFLSVFQRLWTSSNS
jgi:hypothetical protein